MTFKLDHIAVAVSDIEAAVKNFEGKLGVKCERIEDVPGEKAKVAFFDLGGAHLELVAPLVPGSPIEKSIEKRGEGLHHMCLEVQDIELTLRAAEAAGLQLVHQHGVPGAKGTKIAFVHPKGLNGVLLELVEKPKNNP